MPPLLDGMVSLLRMGSRFAAAVSDDEASDLAVEDAAAKKTTKRRSLKEVEELAEAPEEVVKEGSNAEEAEDEDEEFVVEAIKSHLLSDDGVIMFQVKWEGYDDRRDLTWEPEDNLRGSADDILDEYLESVGGRDYILSESVKEQQAKTKKRGRTSSIAGTPDSKPNGKKSRKNTEHPASTKPPASLTHVAFRPPTGSWEDEVLGIDACEGTDGNVMVFLQWANGHKTQHPLEQVYKRCPQKMLKFYESHLSFTPATHTSETSTDILIESSKRGPGRPRKKAWTGKMNESGN